MNLAKTFNYLLIAIFSFLQSVDASYTYQSFKELDDYCIKNLPSLQALNTVEKKVNYFAIFNNKSDYQIFRAINGSEFELTLDRFFESLDDSTLANNNAWVNNHGLNATFADVKNLSHTPYAQKVLVSNSDTIALRGDMHGDIHSLLNFLRKLQLNNKISATDGFKIIDPKFKIVFLGDYVDRGVYGVEVMYTILRLKIENPNQVILVRGNHEDISICSRYGFKSELVGKFADSSEATINRILEKLQKFYELLPVVAYVGCQENENSYNFVQCCHGGMEIGFNPQNLLTSDSKEYHLLGTLEQITECEKLKDFLPSIHNEVSYQNLQSCCKNYVPIAPASLDDPFNGFMWNDFQPNEKSNLEISYGRGITYSKEITEATLQLASSTTHKVCGVIRAHQHMLSNSDPLMCQMLHSHGVARLWSTSTNITFNPWQGIVCTLLLSPDNSVALKNCFDGFDFDTTLCITMAPQFEKWDMHIVNNTIYTDILQHEQYQDIFAVMAAKELDFAAHKNSKQLKSTSKSTMVGLTALAALGTYGIYKGIEWYKKHYTNKQVLPEG